MSSPTNSAPTLVLHIVSAHEQVFSGEVSMVSVASVQGELGILPRHTPLMTLLNPGEARLKLPNGEYEYIYVSGGMMEVQPHEVTILADTVLRGEQIDKQAALEAKRRAEEVIRTSILYTDRDHARVELMKALAQLRTLNDSQWKRKR
ncbi:F0F1 ATP synthase subunit epsilon [Thiohalomonas denitrificans]|uniref:ATP synthase epsilon chain n=1 Tax=Thiohalomonas denitrificans TaxID=415747 RepID=A0A1G5QML2_9GAMM|nr:F0F1 ATP synthase subunit epsilon [Thiohalomonas denitrificans]SCZ62977.1 F-type H+-transporting ATPase subunit epsilon [Thiohalomonas denitrificans]